MAVFVQALVNVVAVRAVGVLIVVPLVARTHVAAFGIQAMAVRLAICRQHTLVYICAVHQWISLVSGIALTTVTPNAVDTSRVGLATVPEFGNDAFVDVGAGGGVGIALEPVLALTRVVPGQVGAIGVGATVV